MRQVALALTLCCGCATAQVWEPTDNGNLLWQKEQQNQIKLVPSQITRTPIDGVSLYNDVERGTWGNITDIGGGRQLITENGPSEDKLTITQDLDNGSLIWR